MVLTPLHRTDATQQGDDCLPFREILRRRLQQPMRGYFERRETQTRRLTMHDRIILFAQGHLERHQVWGLWPEGEVLSKQWGPPEMLDTVGLIVDAVFITIPASVWTWLERRPNPRTADGKYRPTQRYHQDHFRKHFLSNICRYYWQGYRKPMERNRFA